MKYYIYYQYPNDKNRYSLICTCESFKKAKEIYNTNYVGYICNDNGKVLKRYKETKKERINKIGINLLKALKESFNKSFVEDGKILPN